MNNMQFHINKIRDLINDNCFNGTSAWGITVTLHEFDDANSPTARSLSDCPEICPLEFWTHKSGLYNADEVLVRIFQNVARYEEHWTEVIKDIQYPYSPNLNPVVIFTIEADQEEYYCYHTLVVSIFEYDGKPLSAPRKKISLDFSDKPAG